MVSDSRAAAGVGALLPLNEPLPVTVEAGRRGYPRAVLWHGAFRRVQAVHDTWRIDDEWWRHGIVRRYYVLETVGGHSLTIYHDATREHWYVQPYEQARRRKRLGGRRAYQPHQSRY